MAFSSLTTARSQHLTLPARAQARLRARGRRDDHRVRRCGRGHRFGPRHIAREHQRTGGQGTFPAQNSPWDAITGTYFDASNVAHGFLRFPHGGFTEFNAPGAGTGANQGTSPYGINPAGVITGFYVDSQNVYHGFLRIP
jgi:hypothetical protein